MTKTIPTVDEHNIRQVVGVDVGVNFLAAAYDSQGKTTFLTDEKSSICVPSTNECEKPSSKKGRLLRVGS
ncbi:transposase [Geobacillus thermoleovorans B23]|nr:transposase [Geobacillus thermoleovorans B23]